VKSVHDLLPSDAGLEIKRVLRLVLSLFYLIFRAAPQSLLAASAIPQLYIHLYNFPLLQPPVS
jgi:hypothetical protein